jgi:DNA-binding MarR family transcriptional regulator
MTNEFEILKSVESKDTITQRELAKKTGLSLGAVNVLIKRLIHKGLVKIEHINAKSMRYILTPKGLMEKARLTYKYIVVSYNHISGIENRIGKVLQNKLSTVKIILYGKKDELYDIITSKLQSMNKPYKYIGDDGSLNMYNSDEYIIIIWNPDDAESESNQQKNIVNVLNEI